MQSNLRYGLAWVLILTAALNCAAPIAAQPTGSSKSAPITLSIGSVRTELEKIAVHYAVSYVKEISGADVNATTASGTFFFSPEITIAGGEEDAMNRIVAKITGSMLLFGTTTVDEVETPNTAFLHAVPFTAGIESSTRFDFVNVLGEVGYVPWFQGAVPQAFKTLRAGVFMQGGYKARGDNPPVDEEANAGGSQDESSERIDDAIFRAKASARYSPKVEIDANTGAGIGIEAAASVWYDFINTEVYYSVVGMLRIFVSADKSFDFAYAKGSGAPNFNEGEQFSTQLTMTF